MNLEQELHGLTLAPTLSYKRVTCQIEPLVSSPSAILFPFKACPSGGSGCVLLGPDSWVGQTVSQADQACREYAFQRPSLSPGQNFLEAPGAWISRIFFFFCQVSLFLFCNSWTILLYDPLDCLSTSFLQTVLADFQKTRKEQIQEVFLFCLGNGFDLVWMSHTPGCGQEVSERYRGLVTFGKCWAIPESPSAVG